MVEDHRQASCCQIASFTPLTTGLGLGPGRMAGVGEGGAQVHDVG